MSRWYPLLFLALAIGCSKSDEVVPDDEPTGPPWFEDVTDDLGLDFTHDSGPTDDYSMLCVMGSGGAFLDYDGDNRLDMYLIHNGGPDGKTNQLFHQEDDGTFRDVSVGSGLDVAGHGMGAAVGDVNNDGNPDVVLTEFGATRLFRNQGDGKFQEITADAGIDNPHWGPSAAFFDYDRDGWLDLIVVNYVDYDPSAKCPAPNGKLDFCGPRMFPGTVARLYRNLGDETGRFEDVTNRAGLNAQRGKGLGVICADFTDDGWPDMFVANDLVANHLWVNQRDGTFKEEALLRGLAYIGSGAPAANMGIAFADVQHDGLPDLFVTHIIDETHTLWKQVAPGSFRDDTALAGLTAGDRSTGFGTAFVDIDRDGWVDLPMVNGGVARNQDAKDSDPFWDRYSQPNQLFANAEGKFRDISAANPALCGFPYVGRGLAVGDIDNDGAPDLLITGVSGKARLLRNVAPSPGHWLAVRAKTVGGVRDAYGAEVTVRAGGQQYWRLLNPGYSYCVSNDPRGHFGLGDNASYEGIDVVWPDGKTESFPGGPADAEITLEQGGGQ